jgi:RHS repeat-associated protein
MADGENRIGFAAQERDEESRYFAMGFRQYDCTIGRFLSLDPLMDKFPEQSPYSYANNNPISFKDPSGLEPESEKGRDEIQEYLYEELDWIGLLKEIAYANFLYELNYKEYTTNATRLGIIEKENLSKQDRKDFYCSLLKFAKPWNYGQKGINESNNGNKEENNNKSNELSENKKRALSETKQDSELDCGEAVLIGLIKAEDNLKPLDARNKVINSFNKLNIERNTLLFSSDLYKLLNDLGFEYTVEGGNKYLNSVLIKDKLMGNIDNNEPVLVGTYMRGGVGHYMTIIGYKSNNEDFNLLFANPSISINSLNITKGYVNASDFHAGVIIYIKGIKK